MLKLVMVRNGLEYPVYMQSHDIQVPLEAQGLHSRACAIQKHQRMTISFLSDLQCQHGHDSMSRFYLSLCTTTDSPNDMHHALDVSDFSEVDQ